MKEEKVLLVCLALVSIASFGIMMPEAKATVYHGGTISSSETWLAADNPHIIYRDVTVATGVTLTIEAGAEVYFNATYSIFVTGELLAIGTSSSYILFTSNLGTKAAGDWGTIQINSAMGPTTTEIQYSIIKYATTGITDLRGIDITYDYITENDRGIYANSGTPSIDYSTIVNSTYNGIDWTGSLPISYNGRITNSNISDNGGKGVYLMQNVAPPIGHNTISSNDYGIYSVKSGPDIHFNTISDNTHDGVYLEDFDSFNFSVRYNEIIDNAWGVVALRATPNIFNNNISSNLYGLFLDYSPAKIENNTINSNSNNGMYIEKSNQTIYNNDLIDNGQEAIKYRFWKVTAPPGGDDTAFFQIVLDIQNNTITSDETYAEGIMIENANMMIINNSITDFDTTSNKGIELWWSNGTIQNNSIEDNSYGIFTSYGNPEIHGNNIANNADYGVYNMESNPDVSATYNWWDHASGPYHPISNPSGQGDTVSDYVTYDPWLTGPAF